MPLSPSDIRRDLGRAAQAWEELAAAGLEIHFEVEEVTGAVSVSVRDRDGRVLRALTPSEVLDLASGAQASDLLRS